MFVLVPFGAIECAVTGDGLLEDGIPLVVKDQREKWARQIPSIESGGHGIRTLASGSAVHAQVNEGDTMAVI